LVVKSQAITSSYIGYPGRQTTYSMMKGSSSNCAAVALSFGSGSKHRRINFCANSDNSFGISGCIL